MTTDHKLPPITKDMIPKSIEQKTLEALERIEKLIDGYLKHVHAKEMDKLAKTLPLEPTRIVGKKR